MWKKALITVIAGLFVSLSMVSAQDPTPEPPPNCPAFENEPTDVRTGYYMGEGIAYMDTNQLSNAQLSFTCIIRVVDAAYVPAYMGRALTFIRLRDFERAKLDYNRAIQRQPDLIAAVNNRGVTFALQFDFDRAANDFDDALGLDANYLRAINNRAIIHTLQGEYDQAVSLLDKSIKDTGIDGVLEQYNDPQRAPDAGPILFDPLAARLYALQGIIYSARSLDNFQNYIQLNGFAGTFPDERIASASGALESRFTFEMRLDDGSWLLLDQALTE